MLSLLGTALRRLSGSWPHLRAGLILFHLVAVFTLALPGKGFKSKGAWGSRVAKTDLADWADTVGVEPARLTASLQAIAAGWADTRKYLVKPFQKYSSYTATKQGWAMFASPQRNPTELHILGDSGEGPVLLYRPNDDSAALYADFLEHNRVRKFRGRFGRRSPGKTYDALATYLAKRACRDRTGLIAVEVALLAYRSLGPRERERGAVPAATYENRRRFQCEALR